VVLGMVALAACSVDRGGLTVFDLGTVAVDAGLLDAAERDAPMADLGPRDLGTVDFGTVDFGTADFGTVDFGTVDFGTADFGIVDLGERDLGPPDLGPPDLGPPDLGPPDLGPRSCDELYDTATSYQPCAERPTECEFYTRLSWSNCRARCSGLGGRCLEAYVDVANTCTRGRPDSCDAVRWAQICVCSR